MVIVGENLRALIEQHNIVSDRRSFDETSLSLTLDRQLVYFEPDGEREITYGNAVPDSWVKTTRIPDEGYVLRPHSCFLGCSRERIIMPPGYFGLIQTKGTLARFFVAVTSCDGQVDPGFSGNVTFEIANMANFSVRFLANQRVAQLFILKTSTKAINLYNGRYQGAKGPTIPLPER